MIDLASKTIGEIVSDDFRTAAIFSAMGIAYSWRGQDTLIQACQRNQLNLMEVLDKLETVLQSPMERDFDFASWPMDLLADYIVRKYHQYIRSRVPVIKQVLQGLVFSSGKDQPLLNQVLGLFEKASQDLERHMRREELILFPYIRKMIPDPKGMRKFDGPQFDGVRDSILNLMKDHEAEGERIEQIKAITRNFHSPKDADDAYKVAMGLLRDFDYNLRKHLHLENNILFPKALQGHLMGELVNG
jgi:regulator of cell morphogenesis and NO signaling